MIDLTGLKKEDVLSALYNYARDIKEAVKMFSIPLEEAATVVAITQYEVATGYTGKNTKNKDEKVKKFIDNILNAKSSGKYIDKDYAKTILNGKKTIDAIDNIPLKLNFEANYLDVRHYNSLYGQFAGEIVINDLKDYISLKSNNEPKKTKNQHER
jgi:hypothetical protein